MRGAAFQENSLFKKAILVTYVGTATQLSSRRRSVTCCLYGLAAVAVSLFCSSFTLLLNRANDSLDAAIFHDERLVFRALQEIERAVLTSTRHFTLGIIVQIYISANFANNEASA